MAYIPESTVERIKEETDIVSLISEYVTLKKAGKSYKGLCPFHSEKTPSFVVNEEGQFFHCFGCKEGGDAISFVMKMEHLSYVEALRFLAQRLGITIEEERRNPEEEKRRKRLYDINRETMLFYYKNLLLNREAQRYLQKRRVPPQIINQFYLGFADGQGDSLYRHLREKGYPVEDLLHLGLVAKSTHSDGYYDKFRNRLIFPIISASNKIIGFGGRIIIDQQPKYLNSPESDIFHKGNNVYGIHKIRELRDRDNIVLVEGYMDVIGLFIRGIPYAVASLGTALTNAQAKLVKRYGKNIYVCYDGDSAGIHAALRTIDIFEQEGVQPRFITLPEGQDPDDFIKEKGQAAFYEEMEKALDPVEFRWAQIRKDYDIENDQDRLEYVEKLTDLLATVKSDVSMELYIERMSKEVGISKESLKNDAIRKRSRRLENDKKTKRRVYRNEKPLSPIRHQMETPEERAYTLQVELVVFSSLSHQLRKKLSDSTGILRDKTLSEIYDSLKEVENLEILDTEKWESWLEQQRADAALTKRLTGRRKILEPLDERTLSEMGEELAEKIRDFRLKEEGKMLRKALEASNDPEEKKELIGRLQNLTAELRARR